MQLFKAAGVESSHDRNVNKPWLLIQFCLDQDWH